MSELTVHYGEQLVGLLAEARGGIFFEYDPGFIATGVELSPLNLPLGPGVKSRDGAVSMRLPGVFEDSLPDRWGERIMLEWFLRQGISAPAITPLMRLAYIGQRAMGALSYQPELKIESDDSLSLQAVFEAAAAAEAGRPFDLNMLAQASGSAGGARPKALVSLSDDPVAPVLSTSVKLPSGYSHWIVKFDTSARGEDGVLEEAYARMARVAGIDFPSTRLLATIAAGQPRHHFAVQRFDRVGETRIHYHSLAGLCQMLGGDLDYQTFLRVTRRITRDERAVWKAFRRAAFNVLASNRDDHGKNQGFLLIDGEWRLSPAFDITFSAPQQLPERGMAICGERRTAGRNELRTLAEREGLDRAGAAEILEEVVAAIGRWDEFAVSAGVSPALAAAVAGALRRA